MSAHHPASHTTIVVASRDRRERLLATLQRLTELPERPPVIVVDDASGDGTTPAIRGRFPRVTVIRRDRSAGAAARNDGVRAASTPYVAFADDDSWWAPGALERAAALLDEHPTVGLLAARTIVEPDGHDDPLNEALAASPLEDPALPGPEVLGFLACGAVVRRDAFLEVGGFDPRLHMGAEEELLALDLRAAGWRCVHVDDVVAHHAPDPGDDRVGRPRQLARNTLWIAWLRRRGSAPVRITLGALAQAPRSADARGGMLDAVRGLPAVLADRRPVPREVERARRRIERDGSRRRSRA